MAFGSVNIGGGPSSEMAGAAVNISYDNKKSEADATNVQDALDTVFKKKADLNESGKLSEEQLPDMNVSEAFVNTAQKDAPNNNDAVLITDSEDKNIPKRVLWSKIKALFAAASHTHSASNITSGTLSAALGGTGQTTLTPAVTTKGVRQIYAGTSDMSSGSTSLTTGCIYLAYQ